MGAGARTGLAVDVGAAACAGRTGPVGAARTGATVGVGCDRGAGDAGREAGCEAGGVGVCGRGGAGRCAAGRGPGCDGAACGSVFLAANRRRRKSISPTTAPIRRRGWVRNTVRTRERARRPLARLWTHGLPADSRGTVAKSCAQGAAPAKHRGTAGWLRAGAPSRSPLWPRTVHLSTAGCDGFDVCRSFRRPAIHHQLLAWLLEPRMRA